MPIGMGGKTIADVAIDVKRTFGDEAGIQINDTDIIRWVGEAEREILITNPILKAVATTYVTAGVSEYDITDIEMFSIQSIRFNGVKLEYRSFQEAEEYIMSEDPKGEASGDPQMWYEWGGTIILYPSPSSDSPDALKIYYVREPPAFNDVTNTLHVPNKYYPNIVQYVLAKAYEMDEDQSSSQLKMNQFNARLGTLSEAENSNNGMDTYPRITIREEDAW